MFPRCFRFTTDFCYCFFSVFISQNFFTITVSSSGTLLLCCYTASATDLRKLFFVSQAFFTLHSFPIFVTVPRVLRIWQSFFDSQAFFTKHFFPTFGTTCFYQGFPGSWQFFLEGCKASHWGLKRRPGPSVCLNHTMISKRY